MTDYGELIRKEVQKNFPLFGTIRTAMVYNQFSNPDYDPNTGSVTNNPGLTFNLSGVLGKVSSSGSSFAVRRADDVVNPFTDKSYLIPALDLPILPDLNDELVDVYGVVWDIRGYSADPARATYKFWLRPKGISV